MDGEETARKLYSWATDTMKIDGVNSSVMETICVGNMNKLWNFLASNMLPERKAELIRANLSLAGSTNKVGPASTTRNRYLDFKKKLDEKRKRNQALQEEIAKKQHHMMQLHINEKSLNDQVHNKKLQIALLQLHQAGTTKQTDAIQRFAAYLRPTLDRYGDVQRKSEIDGYFLSQASRTSGLVVVMADIMEKITDLLSDLISGKVNRPNLANLRTVIKKKITLAMKGHSIKSILDYTIRLCNENRLRIEKETAQINLEKDAQMLRFTLRSGGLVDESHDPPIHLTVEKIIDQQQQEHVENFMESQRVKQQVSRNKQKIALFLSEIKKELDNRMLCSSRAMERITVEQEYLTAVKVLESKRGYAHHLQCQIKECEDQTIALLQKHDMIVSFRKQVRAKENQICVVMKQVSQLEEKLGSRQTVGAASLRHLVEYRDPHSVSGTFSIKQVYSGEMETLRTIPLYCLGHQARSVVKDIQPHGKMAASIRQAYNALHLPTYLSMEKLLEVALEKKQELLVSQLQCKSSEDYEETNQLAADLEKLKPLVIEQHNKSLGTLNGLLDETEYIMRKTLNQAENAQKTVNNWWHQPGLRIHI